MFRNAYVHARSRLFGTRCHAQTRSIVRRALIEMLEERRLLTT